jgi:hypothetical protein
MEITTVWKGPCILIVPAPRMCFRESEKSDRIRHTGWQHLEDPIHWAYFDKHGVLCEFGCGRGVANESCLYRHIHQRRDVLIPKKTGSRTVCPPLSVPSMHRVVRGTTIALLWPIGHSATPLLATAPASGPTVVEDARYRLHHKICSLHTFIHRLARLMEGYLFTVDEDRLTSPGQLAA